MAHKVFISKGSAATESQRLFIDAVLDALRLVGLDPRIMNENEWSHKHPLLAIREIIRDCDGIVVIAFTRTKIEKGVEIKLNANADLADVLLPTTWNHIEGAIAYSFGLPVLVVAQNGLKSEGLIEKGYDWQVYWSDFSVAEVKSQKFRGFLASWQTEVSSRLPLGAKDPTIVPKELTLKVLFGSMPLSQLWAFLGVLFSLLSAIAVGAYKLGGGKWPWQ